MAALLEVPSTPIRVCIIDDDETIRGALRIAIEQRPELQWVGGAGTVREGLSLLDTQKPDIALIDLGLGQDSGLTLIAYIHQNLPQCDSLVFTVFGDEAHVISSIEAGATGYLTKDTPIDDMVNHLQQMRQGGSLISPMIARGLLKRFHSGPAQAEPRTDKSHFLSEREREVLNMVVRGFMQSEIADILGVSTNTVNTYVRRLYRKLAVNSRIAAINKARELGLVHPKSMQMPKTHQTHSTPPQRQE